MNENGLTCDNVEYAWDEVMDGVVLGAGGQYEQNVADYEHETGHQEERRWLGYRVWVSKNSQFQVRAIYGHMNSSLPN